MLVFLYIERNYLFTKEENAHLTTTYKTSESLLGLDA